MTVALFWRGRVVRSAIVVAAILVMFRVGTSQPLSSTTKITYSVRAAKLETVIDYLSKATGVYFVYSSSKISTTQLVSLSVKDKPLNEVLSVLGRQLQLNFKVEGRHVTVRAAELPVPTLAMKSAELPIEKPEPYALPEFVAPRPLKMTDLQASANYVHKNILQQEPYFDTTWLKRIPVHYLRKLTGKHGGTWFISAGAVANDYSGGFEIQAGIRPIYAVFTPTWLRTGGFHGAYGLGSSIHVSGNFSLNPVYSFAVMNTTSYDQAELRKHVVTYQKKTTVDHQQLKVVLQYALGKNLNLRVGPTLNYTRTTIKQPDIISTETGHPITFSNGVTPGDFSSPPVLPSHYSGGATTAGDKTISNVSTHVWLGWEASISVRVNLSRKR